MFYSFGHHVLRCWMMLDDVLRSLISLKHSVKHRQTFLLFPNLMNNVWYVWTACKTLLDSRTRTRPSLILIWGISVPESLSSTMFYKTCFTLLDSFGQPVKQCWMELQQSEVLFFVWWKKTPKNRIWNSFFKRTAQKCVKMAKTIFGKVRKALGNM